MERLDQSYENSWLRAHWERFKVTAANIGSAALRGLEETGWRAGPVRLPLGQDVNIVPIDPTDQGITVPNITPKNEQQEAA